MDKRIYGNKVDIDYNSTLDFFENRGDGKELKSKYNYVLFQDDSPEIAEMRDKQEKEKINNILEWNEGDTVLDIGCGIGRWGEDILSKDLNYVGADYSSKLLSIAKENLKEYSSKLTLLHGSFQETKNVLNENNIKQKFDKIFINGVLTYINDADVGKCLEEAVSLCAPECEIYLKDSLGISERLTLKEFYSDSLTQHYTAIYRSIEEYKLLVEKYFVSNGFSIKVEGSLFDDELRNRKETLDYFFVLKR